MYLSCPNDDGEIKWAQQWYKNRNKGCVSIKAKYYWVSGWGKEVAWWYTWYTRPSTFSTSPAKLEWIEAKAKAAALEVKVKFF